MIGLKNKTKNIYNLAIISYSMKTKLFLLLLYITLFTYGQDFKFALTDIENATPFTNGVASHGQGRYRTLINHKGEAIDTINGELIYWDKCNRIVKDNYNYKMYLTDKHDTRISKGFYKIKPWNDLFICDNYSKIQIIDKKGNILAKGSYVYFYNYDFILCGNKILNKEGNIVLSDANYDSRYGLLNGTPLIIGKNKLYIKATKKTLNYQGKVFQHPHCAYFVLQEKPGKYKYYNYNGDIIINPLSSIKSSLNISLIKENNKYYFQDENGHKVSDELYDDVHPLLWVNDIIIMKKGDKYKYISKYGTPLINELYRNATPFFFDFAVINCEYTTSQIIDKNGNTIYEFNNPCSSELSYDKIDNNIILYCYTNLSNSILNINTKTIYNDWPCFENGYAIVHQHHNYKNKSESGVIDEKLNVVIPFKDWTIQCISEQTALIYEPKTHNTSLYDFNGKEVFSDKSTGIKITGPFYKGVAPVKYSTEKKWNASGYIYNIYSTTLENIIIMYGNLGNNKTDKLEKEISERIMFINYHNELGKIALKEERYNEALTHFNHVLKINSLNRIALYGKGIVSFYLNDYNTAIKCLKYISNISSLDKIINSNINFIIALSYYNLKDINNAINYSKIATSENNNNIEAQNLLNDLIELKKVKRHNKITTIVSIFNCINNTTSSFSSSTKNNYTQIPIIHNPNNKNISNIKKKLCKACYGTGWNPARERPSFYNYNEENYDSTICNICGSSSNHYHKKCSSCHGTGSIY